LTKKKKRKKQKNENLASRVKIGSKVKVKGKTFKILKPTAKGKKYRACPTSGKGSCLHFGAKGYRVKPGTPAGNSYCARSAGIKSKKKGVRPNDLARLLWNCEGKISKKR
tara:strand:+ start:29156 stop:29485 length:330 start_codon:yes stop_codon:yes gene_type:complete